jgi:hypothetical protein
MEFALPSGLGLLFRNGPSEVVGRVTWRIVAPARHASSDVQFQTRNYVSETPSATGISKGVSKLREAAAEAAAEESNHDFGDIFCWVEKLRNVSCALRRGKKKADALNRIPGWA